MKNKMKIAVFVGNKEYASAIAKGLSLISSGLEITIVENEEEALRYANDIGVIITDNKISEKNNVIYLEGDESYIEDKSELCILKKTDSIKTILNEAEHICFKNTGENFCVYKDNDMKTWAFAECKGGSGVTSVAITLARFLAAETSEKVLYMNMSPFDDYYLYVRADFEKTLPKGKFIYAAQSDMKLMLKDCFGIDEYGVYYFKPELKQNSFNMYCKKQELLELLRCEDNFSHVIVDVGKVSNEYESLWDLTFAISDKKDLRINDKHRWAYMDIVNFSYEEGYRQDKFHIPFDEASFRKIENGISISDQGRYAGAIYQLIKLCKKIETQLDIV